MDMNNAKNAQLDVIPAPLTAVTMIRLNVPMVAVLLGIQRKHMQMVTMVLVYSAQLIVKSVPMTVVKKRLSVMQDSVILDTLRMRTLESVMLALTTATPVNGILIVHLSSVHLVAVKMAMDLPLIICVLLVPTTAMIAHMMKPLMP